MVVDETGGLVASVASLVLREVSAAQLGGAGGSRHESLFRVEWVEAPTPSAVAAATILAGRTALLGAADALSEGSLREVGMELDVYPDVQGLIQALDAGAAIPAVAILDCTGLTDRGHSSDGSPRDVAAAAHVGVQNVLGVLQTWLAEERLAGSRLVVLTSDAVAVHGAELLSGLAAAGVWGLVRSAQSEHPGRFVLLDVDEHEESWAALAASLAADEPQLALRAGSVLVARLARVGSADGALAPPPGGAAWRLDVLGKGTIENLALVESPAPNDALPAGALRIAVRAAGVNFRDVLIALGVYPGEAAIGSEGAGEVIEVGPGVLDLAPGDRVMGMLPGGFGPIAVADRNMVVPMPERWSFVQAASVPAVFLTAYYALVDLARAQPGESLLVHAAAGGVGMAAVQIARHLGVEVFATASPSKWGALEALGCDAAHIASSRTLEFRERFLKASGERGVDIVLNSLAGEFVDASLDLLREGGRFIEMGKTDIRPVDAVADEHPGVAYRAFDLSQAGLERIQQMLRKLLELFEQGVLAPLPITTWDVRRAPEAFRFMSRAQHIGKVVLTLSAAIEARGTVLITGGTGGLGGLVARHLVVEHGLRSVVLTSRRGLEADGAVELRAELESHGAQVAVAACDVADREQLGRLLESVPERYPLTAVVHAAGVLDDGVIDSLTTEQVDRVLAPKVDAAWHLHELTEHLDLAAFVLFSSASATLGGAGQGNYAAGNAFLDALAAYRQARGLPGISMAWGWWAEPSGITAGLRDADLTRMARSGIGALLSSEGLELFDVARAQDRALVLPMRMNIAALRSATRVGAVPALLRGLVRAPARRTTDSGLLRRRLAGASEEERGQLVLDAIRAEVAIVLGHGTPAGVDVQREFLELGFDSLTAVELRNRLSAVTGLQLPATLMFDHSSPVALAGYLLAQLDSAGADREHGPDHAHDDDSRSGVASGSIADTASAGDAAQGTIGALFAQAHARGMVVEFLELLPAISTFRATFDAPPAPELAARPVRLSTGQSDPRLICLPSLLAMSGPHQFARFARAFAGVRDLTALPVPGFAAGEGLPATAGLAIEALLDAVRRSAAGAPVVLVGYSSGGMLAHAVAARLEDIGDAAVAVVLVDSYSPQSEAFTTMQAGLLHGMLERDGQYLSVDDARWTGMGAYMRLFADWRSTDIAAPTLLLRATEPMPGVSTAKEWGACWDLAHVTVDVPGNHFTIMEEHSDSTARAIEDWILDALPQVSGA